MRAIQRKNAAFAVKQRLFVFIVGQEGAVGVHASLVMHIAVGEAEGALGILLHMRNLALQLFRIAPEIIALAKSNVVAPRAGKVERFVDGHAL